MKKTDFDYDGNIIPKSERERGCFFSFLILLIFAIGIYLAITN